MKFRDFYLSQNLIELSTRLDEISKNDLIKLTDKKRANKGLTQIITKQPTIKMVDTGLTRLSYNFKSKPSREQKRHWGYVDFDEATGDIKGLWCDCKDFSYRLWAPYVKNDLSKWDLPTPYKKRMPIDHNKKFTFQTNPSGKTYVCKHLYSLLTNYMD